VHAANLASTLAALERFPEARTQYERAFDLGLPPGAPAALVHCNFGTVLERLGDLDGACDEYEAALESDPQLVEARESLAMILLDRGEPESARAQLQEALGAGGLSAEALLRLTLLHEEQGDAEAARECARLLSGADTDEPDVAFRRAQLLVLATDPEIRDPGAAVEILRALAAGAGAGSSAVWNLLGEALAQQGFFESAGEAMSRALQAAPPDDPARSRYSSRRDEYLSGLGDPAFADRPG
jgi:tetratricopeptide (TPR) repeat protein